MTNVMEAIQDRNSTLSITLDGMPHRGGETGNWNTPETIVAAFQHAVAEGSPYSTKDGNRPPDGLGTAWEMSQVAYYVRKYEMDVADGYPENLRDGRPWKRSAGTPVMTRTGASGRSRYPSRIFLRSKCPI